MIAEKLDTTKTYSVAEAMEILQSVKSPKFEESVDISIKLGVDASKSDQNVRGAVTLPNALGKSVTVAVLLMVKMQKLLKMQVRNLLGWKI